MFTLGQLNERGANWEGWKSYGVSELLIKAEEQGNKVFLAVLSGTEVLEGCPVSMSNSHQTVFSQFHSRGLFLKDLAALVSFPAPLQHKVKHKMRDTAKDPVSSIMRDIRYEASMLQSHTATTARSQYPSF